MRILLVEDDELLGAGVRDALERARHAVDWLRDGRQGLAALRAGAFDLVILDLGLPGMDGLEVLRNLRAGGDVVLQPRFDAEALERGEEERLDVVRLQALRSCALHVLADAMHTTRVHGVVG